MHIFEVLAHLFHPRRSNNHRPHLLHPQSLVSYAFLLIGFSCFVFNIGKVSVEIGSILGYSSEITVNQVITLTNAERAQLGLSQLTPNPALTAAAEAKARDMFAAQYWAHVSPTGKQPWDFISEAHYDYSAAGENLARDFLHGSDMMSAWMNSPTHKANIVNPKYTEIGVGVLNGTLQGVETTLVVQLFGKPAVVGATQTIPPAAAQTDSTHAQQPLPATGTVLSDTTHLAPGTTNDLFSPLQLFKALALSVLLLLVGVLVYDAYVIERGNTVRLVGHNLAHIFFFATVAFLVLVFKAGGVQ